ncbi:MAG: helix-turn-helix transcriptional regulator [Bacteroidales bacterium]|nr:helix-turn-helix transcriptional regulator [Bacteroidales bacterium]
MKSTVKERLAAYLSSRQISKSEFGRTIGVSNAYVSAIKTSIAPDKLQTISSNYPDLNIEWLLTGDGTMIRNYTDVDEYVTGIPICGKHSTGSPGDKRRRPQNFDILKSQLEILELRVREKDDQLKEKDAQIRQLLTILDKLSND